MQLKFGHQLAQARALALLFLQQIPRWYAQTALPDVLLPVPLHAKRLWERGFNQAAEIARPIARETGIQLDLFGIERVKHTAAQSGLSAAERRRNIAGAFVAKESYTGRTVAVLDDVVTTGQTLFELCSVLQNQGAKRVEIWCCARNG